MTRSYISPLTQPPLMDVRTFLLKPSRFNLRSSAASLFRGSEAFGSRNRNYQHQQISISRQQFVFEKSLPLVHRVIRAYLQPDNNSIQIQHRLPVLSQNVQTHISLHVNIRMIDFLRAFDFGRIVRKVLIDCKIEMKGASFVHALIRIDCQSKVENIIGTWKFGAHRTA